MPCFLKLSLVELLDYLESLGVCLVLLSPNYIVEDVSYELLSFLTSVLIMGLDDLAESLKSILWLVIYYLDLSNITTISIMSTTYIFIMILSNLKSWGTIINIEIRWHSDITIILV